MHAPRGILLSLGILAGLADPALAIERYVSTNGSGSPGTNWLTAYTNLQTAMNAAIGGDVICLAGHTFYLTNQIQWTQSVVTVRGGYEATNAACAGDNDPERWPTILCQTGGASRIFFINGIVNGVLQGVTITGGYPSGADSNCYGGGLLITNAVNFAISTCKITNNWSVCTAGSQPAQGGGLYAGNSSVSVSNCVIKGNRAYAPANWAYGFGGGIAVAGNALQVRDSVIANNEARGVESYSPYAYGGGLYVNGGTHQVRNCVLSGNNCPYVTAPAGQGVYVAAGTVLFDTCTLVANGGEGIRRAGGQAIVSNSIAWANGDDLVNFPTNTAGGLPDVNQSCIEDGDNVGTNGCIAADPRFTRGLFLAGDSPCLDTGGVSALDAGLSEFTTRADGTKDTGPVDLGYHHTNGLNLAAADFYVTTGGSGTNSGTNWTESLGTITGALARAQEGTRIHLAAGTYGTNTSEGFPLRLGPWGVQILGQGSTTTVINAAGSNKNVFVVDGVAGDSRIEALTIAGGYASDTLALNQPGFGGGLNIQNSMLALVNCHITNNWAVCNTGSGMTQGGGLYAGNSALTVSNCVIKDNRAYAPANWAYSRGGGIAVAGNALQLRDSVIANNLARGVVSYSPSAYGGGFYVNGGVHRVKNCVFSGNNCLYVTTPAGQGVYEAAGTVVFENCTLTGNGGEGIRREGGVAIVSNSIAWANGDDLVNFPTNPAGALPDVSCSCIEDGDNNGTNRCLAADPQFAYGLYLAPGSPCVDTGGVSALEAGLNDYTTRADGGKDTGPVDLGYHQTSGVNQAVWRRKGSKGSWKGDSGAGKRVVGDEQFAAQSPPVTPRTRVVDGVLRLDGPDPKPLENRPDLPGVCVR